MNDNEMNDRLQSLELRVAALEEKLSVLGTATTGASGQSVALVAGHGEKKLSLKEFVNEFAPKNARETTLAVAYFLENEGTVPFNVQDLERSFRAGKIPRPKNINDMVNKNIQQCFLMEAVENKDSRKAWELTATGERAIQDRIGKG